MYIKIKGLVLEISLLIPLAILSIAYGFLGRYLRILQVDRFPMPILLAIAALVCASIWALPLGLGGVFATAIAIGVVFALGGTLPGAIATVVAGIILWMGLQETDREDGGQEKPLSWVELLATVITIALPVVMAFAVLKTLSGVVAGTLAGAVAGSVCVIGPQLRSAELTAKETLWLLTAIAFLGLSIGMVQGFFTYQLQPIG